MKRNYDFLKHNKAIDDDEVALLFSEWQENLINGDDLRVRLTDFVLYRYAPKEKHLKDESFVDRVMGYQTWRIKPAYSYLLTCYSPLSSSLLGFSNPFSCLTKLNNRLLQYKSIPLSEVELERLDPLTDDQSKRLLMAANNDYWFRDLCLQDRESAKQLDYIKLSMRIEDPILAMVKYINTMIPKPKLETLMNVYDTYGPIDTVVGDALIHIDKFRSF